MRTARRALALMLAALIAAPSLAIAQPGAVPVQDPPSGPGLGQQNPQAPTTPILGSGQPLSDTERDALRDVEAEWKAYIGKADEHHRRMRDMLLRSFDDKTRDLENRYAKRIAEAETRRKNKHADTIALLEQFIKDHPDHKQFTPDAMFRLGDLYLDVADEAVDTADMSAEVIADYSKSLEYWERILTEFPEYRQMPAVLYLVGHYGKTKDERRSLMLFLALSCANKYKWTDTAPPVPTKDEALARTDNKTLLTPYADCKAWDGADPELVRHAWVRGIADYHFTVPGELDESISAYNKVVEGAKDSPLYAEALYKLAWAFYKRDFLLDSIKRFDESVKLYDALVAKGGIPSLELREESLQYIAVAFTDPWEGETDTDPVKSFDRAREFYKGRENEPHVRDVWEAMGAAFMELQAYDQAVDSYRIAIGAPWELHPRNPVVHQEIVNAFEAKGDKFAADQAAGELATRYAPGTPWYLANEKDREAMENQRRIAERALYAAARNTHLAATNLRKEWEAGGKTEAVVREEYLKLYQAAVDLYRTFITQYPESDYVYEFTYYQGEALFFSERYLEAVEQYRWVRDHRELSSVFFLQSAKDILTSYEMEVAREVAAGRLQPLVVPTSAELKAMPQPLTPKPIPPLYVTMQKEWDEYQNVVNDPQTAPIQGLNAALVSLAYLHVDDAIARMEKVMNKFCGVPESVKAKDALLSVYEATGRLDKFTEVNQKFIAGKCGDAKAIEMAQSQNRSVEFKRGEALSAEGKHIEAAEVFYRFYKVSPVTDADKPTALYNAAANYSLGDRPKTAISLYKEFTQSKEKSFRESPYFLEAMRLTAMSQGSVFDYDAAIATNLELYAVAKDAKKRGIKPPPPLGGERQRTTDEIALEALFNAAALAELDRDFKQAVDLFNKYDREETDRRNKDRALFSIARIYRSATDVTNMVAAYDRWRRLYGKDSGNADDYVASYYDTAALWKRKGNTRNAEAAGQQAIDAWRAVGSAQNTKGAKLAGEWQLYFAEKHFAARFVPYKISETAKTIERMKVLKTNLETEVKTAQDKYKLLDAYGVAEYTMASQVRFGETLSMYAEKLFQAPTPKFILDLDKKNPDAGAVAAYEESLQKNTAPFVQQAKDSWIEVIDLAKKAGVSNKWSQLALENLNREFPDEFPVLHQELFTGTEAP
jgi:tetratricopeptide (TPR) repeat protein